MPCQKVDDVDAANFPCLSYADYMEGKCTCPATEGLDKNRKLFVETTCNVLCAPGCSAEMRDDDMCDPECENANCCYNYGACLSSIKDMMTRARWAQISGDKATATPLLETICNDDSYNPETRTYSDSACTMLSNVKGGYDYYGNEMNYVEPLAWEEYETVVTAYATELAVIEDRMGEAAIMAQNAEHFGKLRNKMLLLSFGQKAIRDQVSDLDASTQAGFARIDGLVQDLSQQQRDQFAQMQERFDEVIVGQETALLTSNANFDFMSETEKQRFEDLKKSLEVGFAQVSDDMDAMQNNILLGQKALKDAIAANGEAMAAMSTQLDEMKNIMLENKDMLESMLNGYTQDKKLLMGLESTQEEVYSDYKPHESGPEKCLHDKKTGKTVELDRTVSCLINSFFGVAGFAVDGEAVSGVEQGVECQKIAGGPAIQCKNMYKDVAYAKKVTFQGDDNTVLGVFVQGSGAKTSNKGAFSVHCSAADPTSFWNNVGSNLNSFRMQNQGLIPNDQWGSQYSAKDLDDSEWETGDKLTLLGKSDPLAGYSLKKDVQEQQYVKFWVGDQKKNPSATFDSVFVRIKSNSAIKEMLPPIKGMDTNGNGNVDANELAVFMDSYGMYRTSMAPIMAKIVHTAAEQGDPMTWASMIAKLKNVYGAVHVEFSLSNFKVPEDLPAEEWDLNEDGNLDADEMLHIIAEKKMLMQEGREMKHKWDLMMDEIADDNGDRRGRARRVNCGQEAPTTVSWSDFVRQEISPINNVVDFSGDRFCIKAVKELMQRLLGQILTLWTAAIEAAKEATEECASAVSNLITGALSLNPVAFAKGLLSGTECASNVMELLQLKEEIPLIKTTINQVKAAVTQGHKAVKSWIHDVIALPVNLMEFACNAATRALEVTVDFAWEAVSPDVFACLTVASEGGVCGGSDPVPKLDAEPAPDVVDVKGEPAIEYVVVATDANCDDDMPTTTTVPEDKTTTTATALEGGTTTTTTTQADTAATTVPEDGTTTTTTSLDDGDSKSDEDDGDGYEIFTVPVVTEPECNPECTADKALEEVLAKADAEAALSPCDQYQVERGDTLSHIAKAYRDEGYDDVTWQSICEYNALENSDRKGDSPDEGTYGPQRPAVVGCDYIVPGLVITVCSNKMIRGENVDIEPYRAGSDRHRRRRRASKLPGRHAERTSAIPEHIMYKVELGKNSPVTRTSNDQREKFRQALHTSFNIRRSQLTASNKHKELVAQSTLRSKQANTLDKLMNKKRLREAEAGRRHRRSANTPTMLSAHEYFEHSMNTLHRTHYGFGTANDDTKSSRARRTGNANGSSKKTKSEYFQSVFGDEVGTQVNYDVNDPTEFCRNVPYGVFKGSISAEPEYQPPPEGSFGPESWIDCYSDFWESAVPPNWEELAAGTRPEVCIRPGDQIRDVVQQSKHLLEQRQQDLVFRAAELLHKQRRQMEYTWLEYPDVEFPSELSAQKLLQHQAQLRDWNLQRKEAKDTFKSAGWSSFTVDRAQYPDQFAKFGTSTVLMKNGKIVPSQRSSTEMSFYIGAPKEVNFFAAEVQDVKVMLYPLRSNHYRNIMVKITKGSESHFFTKDGRRDTMKTFTHKERTFYREYRMGSCEVVSEEENTDEYIAVSPYGLWKVDVQPGFFGDASALQGVDRIEFRFKLNKAPVAQPQAGLPLFDGDLFANGITGTTSLSFEEADCSTSLFEACLPDPCMNGGRCHPAMTSVAGKPDFECDCTNDWEGKTCKVPNTFGDDGGQGQGGGVQVDYVIEDDEYAPDADDALGEAELVDVPNSDGSAATAGGDLDGSFIVTIIGVVVGIAILVVSVVHCRRTSASRSDSDLLDGRKSPGTVKTFVNPVYGESTTTTTTLARPKKNTANLFEAPEEVATGFDNV